MAHHSSYSDALLQRTLKGPIHCTGVGLHSGAKITMSIEPADVDSGITFIRTDKRGADAVIPALWDHVVDTRMCTVIGNAAGTTVGTVEHLMSALWGCGIDNAVVRLDGAEVPIMDGSAEPFVFLLDCAGRVEQDALRRVIRVTKPVTVGNPGVDHKHATLAPSDQTVFAFDIDFENAAVARQSTLFALSDSGFKSEISRARTFGFLHEVDALRRMGLARGGSLDNAIVISGDKVLNEGGLRYGDEFVRHKVLDAVGDLYLAGAPILGAFHGVRSGHALNNQLLHALFADRSAWCWDTFAAVTPSGWCGTEAPATSHAAERVPVMA